MAKVAPNLFTGEAIEWWMGRQAIHQDEDMPWAEFRRVFLEKYVSLTYRNLSRPQISNTRNPRGELLQLQTQPKHNKNKLQAQI